MVYNVVIEGVYLEICIDYSGVDCIYSNDNVMRWYDIGFLIIFYDYFLKVRCVLGKVFIYWLCLLGLIVI